MKGGLERARAILQKRAEVVRHLDAARKSKERAQVAKQELAQIRKRPK